MFLLGAQCSAKQAPSTLASQVPIPFLLDGRMSKSGQYVISGTGDIGERVREGSVKIKHHGLVFHDCTL